VNIIIKKKIDKIQDVKQKQIRLPIKSPLKNSPHINSPLFLLFKKEYITYQVTTRHYVTRQQSTTINSFSAGLPIV
jgi:hypothetical protein